MDLCSFHVWQHLGCRDKIQLAVLHLVTEECRGLILFSNQILGRLFLCCNDVTMLKINVKPLESWCFSFLNRATFVRKIFHRDCDWLMSWCQIQKNLPFPPVMTRHAAPHHHTPYQPAGVWGACSSAEPSHWRSQAGGCRGGWLINNESINSAKRWNLKYVYMDFAYNSYFCHQREPEVGGKGT